MKQNYTEFELDSEDIRLYAQFTSYIKTVLIRAKRDYLKKELQHRKSLLNGNMSEEEQVEIPDLASTDEIERFLNWEMVKSYLRYLNLKEAEVLTGIFVNGLTQAECAARMNISQKNVSKHYHRALCKLKKLMEEDGEYGGF